ncbi:MAG: homoaconitate hydratase family protein, partial [Candidatus Omnitrophica bacterium]|nr:homoaconitate hydratase family protein [Candidatus Omnitrophota bacterium]
DLGSGVCHQIIPEAGYVVCGDLVLGADSHTCTYGALNCLSAGVGSTDLAIVMASGKNWLKVPHSVKIVVRGEPPKGVFAKDVILYIIGRLTAGGLTYRSVEFTGDYIENLSMDGRFTICNMAVEMGAKCAIMPADKKVLEWLSKYSHRKPNPQEPDKDAYYLTTYEFDISKLIPQIAKPHRVDNVLPISSVEGLEIDEAFVGTCTNGRLEDLEVIAGILEGRKIDSSVKFIISPASRNVYLEALEKGFISIFIKSGAIVISPGCGPCVGTHAGIPADGEVVISSANRNFKGRMGNPNAFIYLASPLTVACSAIKGRITDPQKFLEG